MKYSEAKEMIREWHSAGLRKVAKGIGVWNNKFTMGVVGSEQYFAQIAFTTEELMYSRIPVHRMVTMKRELRMHQYRDMVNQ